MTSQAALALHIGADDAVYVVAYVLFPAFVTAVFFISRPITNPHRYE